MITAIHKLDEMSFFVEKILTQPPLEQRFLAGLTQEHRDLEFLLKLLLASTPK